MRIIEIATLENGAHRNQIGSFSVVPDGWAVIPGSIAIPDTFPFVNIEVDGLTVTAMTAGTVLDPEHEPYPNYTPTQLREQAYNTVACIEWDGAMLTVTEAAQKWAYYAAEGNAAKTDALTAMIAAAKQTIRVQYPDVEAET